MIDKSERNFSVFSLYNETLFSLGSASSIARIGAMITPYIAQVLVDHNLFSAIGVYAVMGKFILSYIGLDGWILLKIGLSQQIILSLYLGVIAVIVSFLLPIESKGLDLSETGHQMTKGRVQLVNENDAEDDYGTIHANSDNAPSPDMRERY